MSKYLLLLLVCAWGAQAQESKFQERQALSWCTAILRSATIEVSYAEAELFDLKAEEYGERARNPDGIVKAGTKIVFDRDKGLLTAEEIIRQARYCIEVLH
jgi:hypothetical protein